MSVIATIEQRPVGQGGFTTGEVKTENGLLRWVYDCGSESRQVLRDEITHFSFGGDVDLLFLSHLHDDHVSDVDLLISRTKVHEVVLPYLGMEERKLLLAAELARGGITPTYLSFLEGPAAWLLDRGVERVRFINGGDDDEIVDGIEGGFDPRPDKHKWRGLIDPNRERNIPGVSVGVGSQAAMSGLLGQVGFWVFIPLAHKPSPASMSRFNSRLRRDFGQKSAFRHYAEAARSVTGRERLRDAYDEIWRSDHNLVSMSLYSGPDSSTDLNCSTEMGPFDPHFSRWWKSSAGGWMLTGDAKLTGRRRLGYFTQGYQEQLASLDVFQLPHHGSKLSGDIRLFARLGGAPVGFAAASLNNKYGHPDNAALNDYRRATRSDPVTVSELPEQRLISVYRTR